MTLGERLLEYRTKIGISQEKLAEKIGVVSFLTGAWHITWILWIVFIFVELIVKLIFSMKGEKENNEK